MTYSGTGTETAASTVTPIKILYMALDYTNSAGFYEFTPLHIQQNVIQKNKIYSDRCHTDP